MKSRPCVNCTEEFLSTGPGNVVCLDCKSTFADESWAPTKKDADTELLEFAEHLDRT